MKLRSSSSGAPPSGGANEAFGNRENRLDARRHAGLASAARDEYGAGLDAWTLAFPDGENSASIRGLGTDVAVRWAPAIGFLAPAAFSVRDEPDLAASVDLQAHAVAPSTNPFELAATNLF